MNKIITLPAVFLLLLIFSVYTVRAQDLTAKAGFEGQIVNSQQTPVAYASVNLLKATDSSFIKSTVTNEKGKFILAKIPAGTYLITVEWLGKYKVIKGPFTLSKTNPVIIVAQIIVGTETPEANPGTITSKTPEPTAAKNQQTNPSDTLTLSSSQTQQLQNVSIAGKKPLIERRNGKVILNIAGSTLATGNTAMEILSRAPGVTADNEGNISLKGKGGVTIMIDNKPTYLSGNQLATLLRNTDGNAIQSIELMSTPSAKYDAAGTGGIINIKLKKNTTYGTNGTVTAGGGYGRDYKSNASLALNNRSEHFNIFGNYNYVNNKDVQDLAINRTNTAGAEKTYFNQQTLSVDKKQNNSYKAGIDYYLNAQNIFGFVVNGYHNNDKVNMHNDTRIGSQPFRTDSSVLANNPGISKYRNQSYNLNYKGILDTLGQELNIDLDYAIFNNKNDISYNNYFYNAAGQTSQLPQIFRNSTLSNIKIWSGKVDYNYAFNAKTKLETGVKSSYVNTANDLQWENFQNNNWENDPTKSNRFSYKEIVNAAYANFSKEFKSTTVNIGLRTELTHSEGNSLTLQNTVKRNYIDFFPSIALNQNLSADHDIGFSYNRRIDRPDYQSLNPFIYFSDLYTYNQGNPYLNPQYANSFELTYGYKKTTNVTFGYIHTKDVIATTLITDPVQKTLLIKEENLASRDTYSMNINRPFALTSWWNTTNDATLYYSRFRSPDLLGAAFKNDKLTLMLNTMQTFTLSPSVNAELSANYTSNQVYGTYIIKPIYGIDLGISKSFAAQRANIKLAVNDLFNTRKANVSSALSQQDYRLYQKEETRIFRATFTYNFGSSLIKAVRNRSNSSDAEKSRVKSGN